jgi:hypothetical protein
MGTSNFTSLLSFKNGQVYQDDDYFCNCCVGYGGGGGGGGGGSSSSSSCCSSSNALAQLQAMDILIRQFSNFKSPGHKPSKLAHGLD